jgi:hypothetical protein
MDYTPYDLATLLEVLRVQRTLPSFWLNFFPNQINFETKYIDFDKVSTDYRRLSPFVAPNVQGRVITMEGYETLRFAPAYTKPKFVIDPGMVMTRQAGESFYTGSLSLAQRKDAIVGELTQRIKDRLTNTNEWLAARAVIDGQVTIESPDYPAVTVNFRRDASLDAVLAGAAKWDQTTAKPLDDLKALRLNAWQRTGVRINRVIFGTEAWNLLATRLGFDAPATGNLLDTRFRGSETDVTRMLLGFDGAEFGGYLQGRNGQAQIEAWIYNAKYLDSNNVEQDMMSPYDVVGVGDGMQGVRCFGAIQDFDSLQAIDVFMKNYREQDPSVEYLLAQSAPLMVPKQPNATFRITVATAP